MAIGSSGAPGWAIITISTWSTPSGPALTQRAVDLDGVGVAGRAASPLATRTRTTALAIASVVEFRWSPDTPSRSAAVRARVGDRCAAAPTSPRSCVDGGLQSRPAGVRRNPGSPVRRWRRRPRPARRRRPRRTAGSACAARPAGPAPPAAGPGRRPDRTDSRTARRRRRPASATPAATARRVRPGAGSAEPSRSCRAACTRPTAVGASASSSDAGQRGQRHLGRGPQPVDVLQPSGPRRSGSTSSPGAGATAVISASPSRSSCSRCASSRALARRSARSAPAVAIRRAACGSSRSRRPGRRTGRAPTAAERAAAARSPPTGRARRSADR